MEFTTGSAGNSTTSGDNIFIDTPTIIGCEITYGEKKSWQTYSDDIAVELTLDIGKSFTPTFYMGGNFKVDDQSGLVIGWSTAYKIKLFFEALGHTLKLSKDRTVDDQRLPEEAIDFCIGKQFKRLQYISTKLKANGDKKWKDWQQTDSVDTSNNEYKAKFKNAVDNNWIKDFQDPDDDVPFDSEETTVGNVTAAMPL
tara:strand:+ start:2425 stop:3018 length:594 start_codon:yes stop_codon:yes gene_type:complete